MRLLLHYYYLRVLGYEIKTLNYKFNNNNLIKYNSYCLLDHLKTIMCVIITIYNIFRINYNYVVNNKLLNMIEII